MASPEMRCAALWRVAELWASALAWWPLNELTHVARRKMRRSSEEIAGLIATIRILVDVVPLTVKDHESAFSLAHAHNFSIDDAMIVAAALEAGCDRLWSEDMQNGRVVEGRLRIENPFVV